MSALPRLVLTASLALFICVPVRASEPWADERLEVTDGLWGWWDAALQPVGHESLGLRRLESTKTTNAWLDGSGNGRHFVQRTADAQPQFVSGPPGEWQLSAYRFDGEDDYLEMTGLAARWDESTIFIVTAPKSNPGLFRAFLAGNQLGFNDYTTGFTIDFGGQATPDFSSINLEGKGFGGAVDLLDAADEMGTWHVIQTRLHSGAGGVSLIFDGQPQRSRDRSEGAMIIDELTLGARYYSNNEQPVAVGSFLQGDIAEVLIYDRALTDTEAAAVEAYLQNKYADLLNAENAAVASSLLSGGVRPEVQFLVPGFDVFPLPIETNNCNDLFYDSAGRLFLLGYDGRVRIAEDTDGDGLEDQLTIWWDGPTIRMPMGMVQTPEGNILVSSAGRIVKLSDTDGDGIGDREETVVEGWAPPRNFSGGVDAVGLALDDAGQLFFALGTSDYANAYLVDEGVSQFDIGGDRGTIQMVSPDFSERETYCTGVRFNVSLAFNSRGDLFGSEQEGATWLPNGNPFDELLHLQPDRHYGFPPRHPEYLPDVIDEPSTCDYGPQHQSTCGLTFNRIGSSDEANCFGPARWWDDALVCGYSRGNVYRTSLYRDEAGYLAQNQLLAVLRHLTLDTCVAPDGSLVIATHSGGPDWGSGPEGIGRLYKVVANSEVARPVAVWPQSPTELQIAFDRPLTLVEMQSLAGEITVSIGHSLREGDDFEVQRPGYAVVQSQQLEPVEQVAVHSVQVTPDRRNVVLLTDPIVDQRYTTVRLPWDRPVADRAIEQESCINLGSSRNGVIATWTPAPQVESTESPDPPLAAKSLWWPHLSPDAVAEFMTDSQQHADFLASLEQPGTLTLQCRLDVLDMLRPAVQPGSQIDYEWPEERVKLVIQSDRSFAITWASSSQSEELVSDAGHRVELALPPNSELFDVQLSLTTGPTPPTLHISWFTNESSTLRPLSTSRLYVPWMVPDVQTTSPRFIMPSELAGGDWEHGRELFFSEQALCAKCHRMRGEGGVIGPDLSNLLHRDYQSVLRDVLQPSFAINPDHLTYAVSLLDGRIVTGTLRRDGDQIIIGDNTGKETAIAETDVDEIIAQPTSTMPANISEKLNENDLHDLLCFLQAPAPTLPVDLEGDPPQRTAEDVAAVLAGAPETIDTSRQLSIVLVAGDKDHGPGEHDYPAWQRSWSTLLGSAENVVIDTAWVWPTDEQWESADIIAFYRYTGWDDEQGAKLDAFLERGGGVVFIHWAVGGGEQLADRIGLSAISSISFRHGPLDLIFDRDRQHPVTRNFHRVDFLDESYWRLVGDPGSINPLGIGYEEGDPHPLFWTREVGQGRVFVSILGHYSWTFDDPLFRILLFRGMLWTADEDVDRFNELATMGVEGASRE